MGMNGFKTRVRCWNKKTKIMYPSAPLYKTDFFHCSNIEHLVLMFGTGFPDKTGKEIYQSDIVQIESIASYPGEYGIDINYLYIGEVIIVPSKGVCLKNPMIVDRMEENKTWKAQYYKNIVSYRSEIIGNRYQTPDLIN